MPCAGRGADCRTRSAHWLVHLSGPRASQDGIGAGAGEFLFDDRERDGRVDMSEYMEKHTVGRLIGAPPGYVATKRAGN